MLKSNLKRTGIEKKFFRTSVTIWRAVLRMIDEAFFRYDVSCISVYM